MMRRGFGGGGGWRWAHELAGYRSSPPGKATMLCFKYLKRFQAHVSSVLS
jgi:hypothetical protein